MPSAPALVTAASRTTRADSARLRTLFHFERQQLDGRGGDVPRQPEIVREAAGPERGIEGTVRQQTRQKEVDDDTLVRGRASDEEVAVEKLYDLRGVLRVA
jgi:hypothetical protein